MTRILRRAYTNRTPECLHHSKPEQAMTNDSSLAGFLRLHERRWENLPHERAELRDDLRSIFQAMTNTELIIAYLRQLGWIDSEIAETLGISKTCVAGHMARAKERIAEHRPDLAAHLRRDKRRYKGKARIRTDNDG